MGRMAARDAGYDKTVSGVTLDRFCGSGLTAVNFAAGQIKAGMEELIVAGGTEMTSQIAAMQQAEAEAGLKSPGLGTGNARLQAKYPQSQQGVSADAIASQEGISREAHDAVGAERQLGRENHRTTVTNAKPVCRLLLDKNKQQQFDIRHT